MAALALQACLAAGAAAGETKSPPPLPEEEIKVERLTAPDGNRLYVADPAFGHMVDGRMHILDGGSGRFLGMIGTGFGALSTLSPDGGSIYLATTYYPRLSRGQRADVVEIHDTRTLELKGEIDIPPKRAQSISYRGLLATSADGRFLYVQNATPATSVTVVDLEAKKFVAEVPTPGCWSIQTWRQGHRFSAICGDGTLLTVTLDEAGQPVSRERSARFFDPDKDPIYIHPEILGDERYFVSYLGSVYPVRLAGDQPTFTAPWPLVDERDQRRQWRPGGLQVSALHRQSNTLFVNMHDKGYEGSHKNPSKEIWAFHLGSRKRTARIPSDQAISIAVSQGAQPLLYGLNIEKASIEVRRVDQGYPRVRQIAGVGETSMFMELN
ncbi:MAG TPA: amine dehydrogenase large subunit [Rhodocyclaceae bacterium]|nr:amine dehydrogenase large subunit [Rhodocyclaceae bacterium]